MSNHFSYEIDERNLRIQLKNFEVSQREDAWQKYEAFAQQNPLEPINQGFNGFQIKINRSILVPAVFGLVIIVFASILYNFVSIDKNKESEPSTVIANSPAIEEPEEKPTSTPENAALVPANTPSEPASDKAATATTEVANAQKTEPSKPAVTQTPLKTEKEKIAEAPSSQVAKSESDTASKAQEPAVKKKRNRKRDEETISALKPTVVSEDETPVEIPQ